ncbi:NAD-dependent epimerase/dehydratase family protein [Chryseobacterium gallinarum]|uniref:NAD-dependent epimerase/dehydratase family protein n=1 Tax=Chryseobacterium gallinarum TaxID=1324352 RepID=A0ABX6KLY5_CHRGL|nr:NAD-dependent epimerase/dehydratase family protein [Chryseobacterium gallinarum]QIY89655.1 NAD-dependent epimerase/dehydratase family protein [Chryseobacterium gallinarum]
MVFITGATGILGRVITLELLKQGKTVIGSKRKSSNLEEVKSSYQYYTRDYELFFDRIQWIDVDFDSVESIRNALADVDEVYHCAAIVSYDPEKEDEVSYFNINATKNILEACKYCKIKKILYVSSSVIFKDNCQSQLIHENSEFIPDYDNTVYALSKLKADKVAAREMENGLPIIIINPGMIIGTGNIKKSSSGFLHFLTNNFYTFSGGTACVDVRDVARTGIKLMEKNKFGERFLIASENKTYKELFIMAGLHAGRRRVPLVLGPFILNIGRIAAIFVSWLFPSLRLLTKQNIRFLTTFPKVSNKKITDELNYTFIPIEKSLAFHLGHLEN